MNKFFDINSVVVVWASEKEGKIWNDLIKNLSKYRGKKFWVNPNWWKVGRITFLKYIKDLPIVPDIAVFVIPAKYVLEELENAWQKWIKRVIVISAWFKEVGNFELEDKIIAISSKYNIQLLWPNCLWYVDSCQKLDLSFWSKNADCSRWKDSHNIAMISQSWAMAVAITDWAISKNIWFSKMISMWNKAWLSENDFLIELEKDEDTKVIALYLESIERWEEFFKITQRLSKKRPIILVKSWISKKWSIAASSHTWALASQKEIQHSAFAHAWIHYTHSLEDFFLWWQIFSEVDIESIPNELVIVTNAWWPWVMTTDHCEKYGVKLSDFSEEDKKKLKTGLSKDINVNNPIDIIWDADSLRFKQILNNLLKLSKKRAILIMLTAQSVTDVENIARIIIEFKKQNPDMFVMVSFMWWKWVIKWREILRKAQVLEYDYPRKAIISYSRVLAQQKWQKTTIKRVENFDYPENLEELKIKLEQEQSLCSNELTWKILSSFWINHQREVLVTREKDIKKACKKLDTNLFVARISSPDIPHKSDVWWVILDIDWIKEAKKAYKKILKNIDEKAPDANVNGVAFAEMILKNNSTKNIFVWFKRDHSFWDILIVWMWGIFVNIFEDVSRRIWIVWKKEINVMLTELKTYPILRWTRGQDSINFDKLIDTIFRLQFIFKELTYIKEIDINPIFASPENSVIVDAKFYL